MQNKHAGVLNTLVRVQRFLDTNGPSLGAINQSGYRAVLDDVVTTLSDHAVNQTSSIRTATAETAKERVLRNAIKVNHMRSIAAVAAAQLRQVPEFLALKMPPQTSTSRSLISWAGAMANAASQYEKTFVAAGLPTDFLAQLQAAADALETAIANRGATKTVQSGATAGLDLEVVRGRQAVKVLDTLVQPLISNDLALLSQWNTARRFGGRQAAVPNTILDAAAKGPTTPVVKPTTDATDAPPTQSAPAPLPAASVPSTPAPAPDSNPAP